MYAAASAAAVAAAISSSVASSGIGGMAGGFSWSSKSTTSKSHEAGFSIRPSSSDMNWATCTDRSTNVRSPLKYAVNSVANPLSAKNSPRRLSMPPSA